VHEEQLVEPEQTRVQLIAVEGRDERAELGIPGALQNLRVQRARPLVPALRPVGETELRRDAREALATGPAHHRGEGVDLLRAAPLPQPGIRLIVELQRALAER